VSMEALTKPTVEEVRRRRAIREWIPSVIIAAVLVVIVVITLVVQTQGIGQPRTLPPAVAEHGYSKFDDEGMRYISDTRTVWFDLRNKPMLTEPLKLPADGTTSVGPREGIFNYLGLYGNDTPVLLPVESVQVVSEDGRVTRISALAISQANFGDVRTTLAAASAYGLDQGQIEAFLAEAPGLNRAGESYNRKIGPGLALGVPISVTISCTESVSCTINYVVDLHDS
jgi:hypothetical protein